MKEMHIFEYPDVDMDCPWWSTRGQPIVAEMFMAMRRLNIKYSRPTKSTEMLLIMNEVVNEE